MIELAWPRDGRPFKLAERVLFRLLTRDENPALLFEFQKMVGGRAGRRKVDSRTHPGGGHGRARGGRA